MTLTIAKKEIIEILKRDGIVYACSTENTKNIMITSKSYNKFHDELKEIFYNDIVLAISVEISPGEYENIYFLNSIMSVDMAEDLTKQFYKIFKK